MIVTVVGAGGHVGLPFALLAAAAGHKVYGFEIDSHKVVKLSAGYYPYEEKAPEGTTAQLMLRKVLDSGHLKFGWSKDALCLSDVVVVMMGTPVDEEGNPRVEEINNFFEYTIVDYVKKTNKVPLIILRSTVAPGTTDVLCRMLHEKTGKLQGEGFHLVFAPERVAQGKSLIETATLPQLIGAYSDDAYIAARDFFKTFNDSVCFQLKMVEAELAKLMTNMYRYVNFALANEFLMIADAYGADYEKIRYSANFNYARMDLAPAGPNVGGPCLYKDGKFLVSHIPYAELIETSFQINEKMPEFVYKKIRQATAYGPVAILGVAFKANNEDTRNSLSFKLMKILRRHGMEYFAFDPHVDKYNGLDKDKLNAAQVVVVMTPHHLFNDMEIWKDFGQGATIIDLWKHLKTSHQHRNGIYWHRES